MQTNENDIKFHHTISYLPAKVTRRLDNKTINDRRFADLVSKLIELYQKSDIELFYQFLEQRNLSFSKPSEYLHALRKILNYVTFTLSEDVLKKKFIKGFPESIRGPISLKQNESLDDIARKADIIMQYKPPTALTAAIGYTDTSNSHLCNTSFNNMIVRTPNNNITNTNPVSCSMRGAL